MHCKAINSSLIASYIIISNTYSIYRFVLNKTEIEQKLKYENNFMLFFCSFELVSFISSYIKSYSLSVTNSFFV